MTKNFVRPAGTSWKRKRYRRSRQKRQAEALPRLRFTPSAWAKLVFLRDIGPTEIGAMGIAASGDPLLIEDLRLVRQQCDWASVQFDDLAVADFFDEMVDAGRRPAEFGRVWIHTHPGSLPQPSATDEETFQRVFGACDWAVMFILARGGASYARLRLALGGSVELPVEVQFSAPFAGSDRDAWQREYDQCVTLPAPATVEPEAVDPLWQASRRLFDDMPGAETVAWRQEVLNDQWW
jgi:hypothetical protein